MNSFLSRSVTEELFLDVQNSVFLKPDPDRVLPRRHQGSVVQVVKSGHINRPGIAVRIGCRKSPLKFCLMCHSNNACKMFRTFWTPLPPCVNLCYSSAPSPPPPIVMCLSLDTSLLFVINLVLIICHMLYC
jgi:hypothetical protein